jgi:hypothetical protein
MSRNDKRLHHDGGVTGIGCKRWGDWRNVWPMKCLPHDGGLIGTIVGTGRRVSRCNPINRQARSCLSLSGVSSPRPRFLQRPRDRGGIRRAPPPTAASRRRRRFRSRGYDLLAKVGNGNGTSDPKNCRRLAARRHRRGLLYKYSLRRAGLGSGLRQRASRDRALTLDPSAGRAFSCRRQCAARHSAGRHDGLGRRLETEAYQSNERLEEGDRATVECSAPRSREVPSKNQKQRLTTRSRPVQRELFA